jgi:hypothetical protein
VSTVKEKIVRKAGAIARLGVGHTLFEEKFAPRLTKVQLSERAIGYTESSIDQLIAELIAESADAPKIVPEPNTRRAALKRAEERA